MQKYVHDMNLHLCVNLQFGNQCVQAEFLPGDTLGSILFRNFGIHRGVRAKVGRSWVPLDACALAYTSETLHLSTFGTVKLGSQKDVHFCKYVFEQQHGQFWQATSFRGRPVHVCKNGASMDLAHGVVPQAAFHPDATSGGETEEQTLACRHYNDVAHMKKQERGHTEVWITPWWSTGVRVITADPDESILEVCDKHQLICGMETPSVNGCAVQWDVPVRTFAEQVICLRITGLHGGANPEAARQAAHQVKSMLNGSAFVTRVCSCLTVPFAIAIHNCVPCATCHSSVMIEADIYEPLKPCLDEHFWRERIPHCRHQHGSSFQIRVDGDLWHRDLRRYPVLLIQNAVWGPDYIDTTQSDCIILPHPVSRRPMVENEFLMAEIFCGGYGGWHRALNGLRDVIPGRVVWSIDFWADAIRSYAINFDAAIIDQRTARSEKHGETQPCQAILGDIQEQWWIPHVMHEQVDAWAISSPCQPWSTASNALGFDHPAGHAVIHTLLKAKFFRPPLLLFENVRGIRVHEAWPVLLGLFAFCGYQLEWADISQLAEQIPQSRKRYLAVFRDVGTTKPESARAASWIPRTPLGLKLGVHLLKWEDVEGHAATVEEDILNMYMDIQYMPHLQPWQEDRVESVRCRSVGQIFGCIMASYTRSHQLDKKYLRQKGLHGHLVKQGANKRFLSIAEASTIMGTIGPLWLPKTEAFTFLGNGISPVHAALVIANALVFTARTSKWKHDPASAVAFICHKIPRCDSLQLVQERGGMWIKVKECTERATKVPRRSTDACQSECSLLIRSVPSPPMIPQTCQAIAGQMSEQCEPDPSPTQPMPQWQRIGFTSGVGIWCDKPDLHRCIGTVLQETSKGHAIDPSIFLVREPVCPENLHCVLTQEDVYISDRSFSMALGGNVHDQECNMFGLPAQPSDRLKCACDGLRQHPKAPEAIVRWELQDQGLRSVSTGHRAWTRLQEFQDEGVLRVLSCLGWQGSVSIGPMSNEDEASVKLDPMHQRAFVQAEWLRDLLCIMQVIQLVRFHGYSINHQTQDCILQIEGVHITVPCVPRDAIEKIVRDVQDASLAGATCVALQICESLPNAECPDCTVKCGIDMSRARIAENDEPTHVAINDSIWTECAIAWAGGRTHLITVRQDTPLGSIVKDFAGAAYESLQEVRCNGKTLQMDETAIACKGKVIRCFQRGIAGGVQNPAKAQLAQTLIDGGYPVHKVSQLVDNLSRAAGGDAIRDCISNARLDQRFKAVLHLAESHNVETAGHETKPKGLGKGKHEGQRQKPPKPGRHIRAPVVVDASDYQLLPDYFQGDSGKPIQVITEIASTSVGVVLTCMGTVIPWLDAKLSVKEELAAIVLDGDQHAAKMQQTWQSIHFPAQDKSGNKVVLRGLLIQFGQKPVKVSMTSHSVVKHKVVTCHATAFASDYEGDVWQQMLQMPAKAIVARFQSDEVKANICAIWGRSFRQQGKRCPIAQADSIRIYLHMPENKLHALLKESGFSKINVAAQNEHGKPSDAFTMTWTKLTDRAQFEQAVADIPHLGYIRTPRGTGLRTEHATAEDAWKVLRPLETYTQRIAIKQVFKLLGLPPATTSESLSELATALKWKMRPLKKLDPTTWVVGAEHALPNDVVVVNDLPVLIRELPSKYAPKSALVVTTGQAKVPSNPSADTPDPWMQGADPWATSARPAKTMTMAAPGNLASSEASSSAVSQRMTSMESNFASLREELQQQVKAVETKHAQDMNVMSNRFTSELNSLKTSMQTSFSQSLQDALQLQTQEMLKAIQATRPSPRGSEEEEARKKHKPDKPTQ